MDAENPQLRLSIVGVVVISLIAALFARMWFLQVLDQQEFEAASAENRLREIHVEGPRGRILDRDGQVLVDNAVSIVVGLDRTALRNLGADDRADVLARLADDLTAMGYPSQVVEMEARIDDARYGPLDLVPVAEGVDEAVEQYLLEQHDRFPGVRVERRSVRYYPHGSLAAHVLGYVGEINEEQLIELAGAEKPYETGDTIGKAGVEASYEDDLRGVPGTRTVEVNAEGDFLGVVEETPPIPGHDVWLSIDLELQQHAEATLAQVIGERRSTSDDLGMYKVPQGSAVVIDPRNGQVLAMASNPTYDPTDLVNGISTELWDQLNDEASGLPFNNWAMQGTWAPGSTFKLVTAYAGLKAGLITPQTGIHDANGNYTVRNCTYRCDFGSPDGAPVGTFRLAQALAVSSDYYFYKIGDDLWQDRGVYGETALQEAAGLFGFGERTGIDLPGENSGAMPTEADLREAYAARPDLFQEEPNWRAGDNVLTAIGQGYTLVTPLQLANAYATFANGGTRYVPHVALRITQPTSLTVAANEPTNFTVISEIAPEVVVTVPFMPGEHEAMVAGFQGVTTDQRGTARGAFNANETPWPVASKTGTAQVDGKQDTSVYAAYGPAYGPEYPPAYTAAAILPESGNGGAASAPLVLRILQRADESLATVTSPPPPLPPPTLPPPPDDATTTTSGVPDEGSTAGAADGTVASDDGED